MAGWSHHFRAPGSQDVAAVGPLTHFYVRQNGKARGISLDLAWRKDLVQEELEARVCCSIHSQVSHARPASSFTNVCQ